MGKIVNGITTGTGKVKGTGCFDGVICLRLVDSLPRLMTSAC